LEISSTTTQIEGDSMASDTRLTLSYDVSNATTPTYHAYADYNFVMTFTANDGYEFIIGDSANFLEYADSSTWTPDHSRYITVDGVVKQVKMTTQMKDYPTTATMHVKAYAIAQIPVTQNLANCTSNFSDTSTPPNSTISFTLTANENYKFNSAPSITINSTTESFNKINDYVYSDTITAPASGTIVVDASAQLETYNITFNLTRCTSNFTNTTVAANTTISVTLTGDSSTANTPLIFTEKPTITNGTFTRVHDYQYTCQNFVVNSDTTITGVAGGDGNYNISYTLSNCSVAPAIYNTNYTSNTTFTATANTGYKFSSANPPYYTNVTDDRYYFTKISDYKYTLDTNSISAPRNISIYATAISDTSPPVATISYGFVNIFLPSLEDLQKLSKQRFESVNGEYADLFKYVFKVHKMYFNIPATAVDYITLAYYRSNILTNITNDAYVSADCGDVFISELYHNIFDYQHTATRIYLPMIGYQSIDTTYIMNSTLHLTYKANIITGAILAELSTTERGNLYQFDGYGGFDIPYMLNEFKTGVNHDLYQSSAYLGSFIPSIQLITSIPYGDDSNNPFGYGVSTWTKIGNCTGYIKCEDIQLILTQNYITNSEMNMITELLKDGIFI